MTPVRSALARTALLVLALLPLAAGCTGGGEPKTANPPAAQGEEDAGAVDGSDVGPGSATRPVRWQAGVLLDIDTYQDLDDLPSGRPGLAPPRDPVDVRVTLRELRFEPGAVVGSWTGPPEVPTADMCLAILQPPLAERTIPLPDGSAWCFRTVQGRVGVLKVARVDLHAVTVDMTVWEGTSG
ncbi:hypothetical protein [Kitasatospora sp. NPDC088346]|uniref:hypothetical protein n=1 Tax=Kitasatospora sp. NPDC088346 TaxID=3364073 RepID=UPI00382F7B7B